MQYFSVKMFKSILKAIDDENCYDLETFSEAFCDVFADATSDDLQEVTEFLSDQLNVNTDDDVFNMSEKEIDEFCDYINDNILKSEWLI